jgi:hypothetical protein
MACERRGRGAAALPRVRANLRPEQRVRRSLPRSAGDDERREGREAMTDNKESGGRCGLPWGVCPECKGQSLESTNPWERAADRVWCPRCLRRLARVDVDPCPWPATVALADARGKELRVCASHAAHPSARKFERRADGAALVQAWTCGRCGEIVRAFVGGTVAAMEMHVRECAAPRCPVCRHFAGAQGPHPAPELASTGYMCPHPFHARSVGAAPPRCKTCGQTYDEGGACADRFHATPAIAEEGARR